MAQVVTPAPPGMQDQETRDWYKAQKYRQLIHQLEMLREEIASDDKKQLSHIGVAISELREVFNSLVPPEQRLGVIRVARRSA